MAYLDYGTVIKKNDKVISKDSLTEQEIIINDSFRIKFYKCHFYLRYNNEEKCYNDFQFSNKYSWQIQVGHTIFKIKRCRHHDEQFLLWFRFNDDEYKVLFGYGVGCDWIDKKSYRFYKRFVGGKFDG